MSASQSYSDDAKQRDGASRNEVAAFVGCWAFWYGGYYGILVPRPSVLGGSAVLITWIVQAATAFREREPSWVDRAGRVLGHGWIALGAGTWLEYLWIWR